MDIRIIPLGPLSSNMYVVRRAGILYVIDPSVDPDPVRKAVPDLFDFSQAFVLITHAHYDHIAFAREWSELLKCSIYMSPDDGQLLASGEGNCSSIINGEVKFDLPYKDIFSLDHEGVEIIKTPGHTSGSVCIMISDGDRKALFTGDTLFSGSCGRTDFPTGSSAEMMSSLKMLSTLDDAVEVYPGHGSHSDIGTEKQYNPYFL